MHRRSKDAPESFASRIPVFSVEEGTTEKCCHLFRDIDLNSRRRLEGLRIFVG
jgi:hypothetical protein